jgi:NhaP-type Na+/H+ or K+/H+ antiporter
MSAGTHGAGCGVVLGLVAVLLAQQFAYLSLSSLDPALEDLVLGAIVGGILGGLIGWALGRRYLRQHPTYPAPTSER